MKAVNRNSEFTACFFVPGRSFPAGLKPVQMAEDEVAVIIAKVHAVTLAIAEPSTVSALILLHPRTVAIWLKAVLPHIYEIIFVNVALMVVGPDAAASGDGAVDKYRSHRKSGLACVEMIPDLPLIFSEKAFTAVACTYPALLPGLLYELHKPAETLPVELQVRILSRPTYRKDRKQTPAFQS